MTMRAAWPCLRSHWAPATAEPMVGYGAAGVPSGQVVVWGWYRVSGTDPSTRRTVGELVGAGLVELGAAATGAALTARAPSAVSAVTRRPIHRPTPRPARWFRVAPMIPTVRI